VSLIPGGTDRLERDREEAHRRYHEAFAALDRVVHEAIDASTAVDRLATFQSLLVQFLQQLTPYLDSKLRAIEQTAADATMAATAAQRASQRAERAIERPPIGGVWLQPDSGQAAHPFRGAEAAPALDRTYLAFEDCFRGSEEEIRARMADYAPLFDGAGEVVDLGCGRGEFLDVLRARGIAARGVDINPEMVEVCRAKGLKVEVGDALSFLRALPNESVGGIFSAQVVEHLEPAYLLELLRAAAAKLGSGGRLVIETINPTCWVAFFESYIRDLTHVRPLHPETLKYLLVASGFNGVELRFRTPIPDADRLQRVATLPPGATTEAQRLADLVSAFNLNMERLNDRLFTHLDYAVIAGRA
jgi:SAM-dependent methyltransferase